MILAVLYSTEDTILAAALACEQHVLGDQYWPEVQGIDLPRSYETAYLDLKDIDLANRLLNLHDEFPNGRAAATAVEQYVRQRQGSETIKRQAA